MNKQILSLATGVLLAAAALLLTVTGIMAVRLRQRRTDAAVDLANAGHYTL